MGVLVTAAVVIAVAVAGLASLLFLVSPSQGQLGCEPQVAANETTTYPNVTLLSNRYIPSEYGPELIGEVMNVGNSTAYPVWMNAYFYDRNHELVGYQTTSAVPSTMEPGDRSAFRYGISSGSVIEKETATYELLAEWTDNTSC
jgi:hypothetical protein